MNHDGTTNDGDDPCAWLDAYLDREMRERDALAFESHLTECSACADAVDEQRWMDELLRSAAASELASAPKAAMIAALNRRRSRKVSIGALAAAALAAAAAWPWLPLLGKEGLGEDSKTVALSSKPQESTTVADPSPSPSLQGRGISDAAPAAATFVSSSDALVVPLASPATNVTVVEVYPTINSERRLRLAAALSSISSEPNGG
jgi:hypothetical protein